MKTGLPWRKKKDRVLRFPPTMNTNISREQMTILQGAQWEFFSLFKTDPKQKLHLSTVLNSSELENIWTLFPLHTEPMLMESLIH